MAYPTHIKNTAQASLAWQIHTGDVSHKQAEIVLRCAENALRGIFGDNHEAEHRATTAIADLRRVAALGQPARYDWEAAE